MSITENKFDFIILHFYVVLVTGGYNTGAEYLDSTELMVDFKPWRPAANLPSPRYGPRAASLDNKVFLFGQ